VTYIAFFVRDGKWIAQLERFFPNKVPVQVKKGRETLTELKFWWPDIPLEDMGSYGFFRPGQPFTPAQEEAAHGGSSGEQKNQQQQKGQQSYSESDGKEGTG
jgi:hypothetical protein